MKFLTRICTFLIMCTMCAICSSGAVEYTDASSLEQSLVACAEYTRMHELSRDDVQLLAELIALADAHEPALSSEGKQELKELKVRYRESFALSAQPGVRSRHTRAPGDDCPGLVQVVGGIAFRACGNGTAVVIPDPASDTFTLQLPANMGTSGYVLTTDGSTVTSWQPVSSAGGTGISQLNGLITSTQFFAVGTAGTVPNIVSSGSTHTFNTPLAATASVTAGLLSNTDYTHFNNTYTTVLAATSLDVPNTLALRNSAGSFVATTVTVTGGVVLQSATTSSNVTLLPNTATTTYTFRLPPDTGTNTYVLTTDGAGVTSWQPGGSGGGTGILQLNRLITSTQFFANGFAGIQPTFSSAINTHTLNIPLASTYGVLAGLITSTDYFNFRNTYTTVVAGTPLDIPSTLVLRDDAGSFAATSVAVTAGVVLQSSITSDNVTLLPDPATTTYTFQLPPDAGTEGYVLTTDGGGVTSWQAGGGGGVTITTCSIVSTCTYLSIDIVGTSTPYQLILRPDDTVQPSFEMIVGGDDESVSLGLVTKGAGALYALAGFGGGVVRGNARGAAAVDLQMLRTQSEDVASGAFSALIGGINNQAASTASVVIGGGLNTIQALSSQQLFLDIGASAIVGGFSNIITGTTAAIIAGSYNNVSAQAGAILAGSSNTVTGTVAVVAGGAQNIAGGIASGTFGGAGNTASGVTSAVIAGQGNVASGFASIVLGGGGNQASGVASLAAGVGANAMHDGSFVWADYSESFGAGFISRGDNTFNIRAIGGAFFDANITTTGSLTFTAPNTNTLTIKPSDDTDTYTLQLPPNAGTNNYVLTTDGAGVTSWQPISSSGGTGIAQLNGLSTSTQFFAVGTAGTGPNIVSSGSTHTFNTPLASTLTVTGGVISNTDYTHFNNTYTTVLAATSLDVPRTLVLRDSIGSFAATTVTVTGGVVLQSSTASNNVTLLPNAATTTYTFRFPSNTGTNNYVLTTDGAGVTSWQPTAVTGITTLNGLTTSTQFFAVGTAGTGPNIVSSGNTHTFNTPLASTLTVTGGVISNTDYTHFVNTYTTVLAATSLDVPSTLVSRDTLGSFAATTVTVTGGVVLQSSTNGNKVSLLPNGSTNTYTLQLPANTGTNNYVLTTDGTGVTSWQSVSTAAGGGIIDLNGLTTSTQFFAVGTAGTGPNIVSSGNTHTFNTPLASTLTVTGGVISNTDYTHFVNTYTTVLAATSLDVPSTLVSRDTLGSFAATTVTVTGGVVLQSSTNGNKVSLLPNGSTNTYTLQLPANTGTNNYVLTTDGTGVTSWQSVSTAAGGGIIDLNGLTTSTQFFAVGTAGTGPNIVSSGNTHTFNTPLASTLTVTGGVISNTDYTHFVNTYTTVLAATSLDTPNTLVLRDGIGSFAATTVTVTGGVVLQSSTTSSNVTLLPNAATSTYTFRFPSNTGTNSYVLTTDGAGVTSWQPTAVTGITTLNGLTTSTQFFAVGTAGTGPNIVSSGNTHTFNTPLASTLTVTGGVISNTDYTHFVNTYTTVLAATSLDTPNTLVLRDGIGSFAATTVTVTGGVVLQSSTTSSNVTLLPNAATSTYTFRFPSNTGTNSYVLTTDGAGVTSWQPTAVTGITTLNGLTTSTQFFAVGTAGTGPNIVSSGNTHTFNTPLASTLTVTGGLISNTDYTHFNNTYTTVLAATSLDVPLTLVLRDGIGSFAATTVTVTGGVVLQSSTTSSNVTLLPNAATSTYTFRFPSNTGTNNYVLTTDGTGVTSWQPGSSGSGITTLNGLTTSTQLFANGFAGTQPAFNSALNTHTLNIPLASTYGVLAGLITSTDYFNFRNTYTTILAGTPLNIPNTLVKRDGAGSFAAQNITAATIQTCSIVSTCTYVLIQIPDANGVPYQLILQPNANIQPSFEVALAGPTDISLELLVKGDGALYVRTDLANDPFTGSPNVEGDARGTNAIDLQMTRTSHEYVATGPASALVGGFNNQANSNWSAVIGGSNNSVNTPSSIILGGDQNSIIAGGTNGDAAIVGGTRHTVSASTAAVVAGDLNTASGLYSVVVGGQQNAASGAGAVAVGGSGNTAVGSVSGVLAGGVNNAQADYSTVVGGLHNTANGVYSSVVGGLLNTANNDYSAVVAGQSNTVSNVYSAIIAGAGSSITGFESGILAGAGNSVTNNQSAIVGGQNNIVDGEYSVIAAGFQNNAHGDYSAVVGGANNLAAAFYSAVVGGEFNAAYGQDGVVLGGNSNFLAKASDQSAIITGSGHVISGPQNAIVAGNSNTIGGTACAILGGVQNSAGNLGSVVLGGIQNSASGPFSIVVGGALNEAFGVASLAAGVAANAIHDGSFVWADHTDIFGSPFVSRGENSFNIRANGGVEFALQATTTTDIGLVISADSNIQPSVALAATGTLVDISLELVTRGSGAFYVQSDYTGPFDVFFGGNAVAGGPRGRYAVDLQLIRTATPCVAQGIGSALMGGFNNIADRQDNSGVGLSAVVGGALNEASGIANIVLGGLFNQALGEACAIVAGTGNNIQGQASAIIAGSRCTINSIDSVIAGGGSNVINISADNSIILAGLDNIITGSMSLAAGYGAFAANYGSFVWADGTGAGLTSAADNSFNVLATGGVFMQGIDSAIVAGNPVLVDPATGRLGTITSAARYKDNIKPLPPEFSKRVLDLEPVTFHYKTESPDVVRWGLIADAVEEIFPELVVKNKDGLVETVRYHDLPILLLNELKKQNVLIRELQQQVAQLLEK